MTDTVEHSRQPPAAGGVIRLVRAAEAVWWMMRQHFHSPALIALAGWLAAGGNFEGRLVGVLAYVAFLSGFAQVANDLLDHEGDAVTAPYLPIPAGAISPRGAKVGVSILGLTCILFLAVGSASPGQAVLVLGITVTAAMASGLYSLLKRAGALASFFVAHTYASPALMGWALAGRGHTGWVLLVFADCFVAMLYGNTLAAIRDVDKDPLVGNRTLPVRIGTERAFTLSFVAGFLSYGITLALALSVPGGEKALPLLALLMGWVLVTFPRVRATTRLPERGRDQRTKDLRPLFSANAWRICVLIAVFSLPAGLLSFAALETVNLAQRYGYRKRVLEGGLARAVRRA